MSANPVLVEVYRGGVLESFHRGVVCIVDAEGEILFSAGNSHQLCYPRSAMKFLQVLPLIMSGGMERFGLTLEEIAIMCGSHNAEPEHLRVVRSILHKIQCTEADLECGAQYPTSKKHADELLCSGTPPSAIHNNCSGKHAGMLAWCRLMNVPTKQYIHPTHPLQQRILELCELMYGYSRTDMHKALDGCSAPIFSIPVYNQAWAYARLVGGKMADEHINKACSVVVKAVSEYPFMVAGTKRYCTDMMKVTAPQIIGKTGAEGVFCMSFTERNWGVCIKIDDGKMQPQYNVAQALIESCGFFSAEMLTGLSSYATYPVHNFNKLVTGEVRVAPSLIDGFQSIKF
ncbi:MAG: asparaginase [Bacteroidota bacterium]